MGNKKLIRRFPSGAVRSDNSGRPRPDMVSPYGINEISMQLVDNQNDFGAMNYAKGIPEEACLESLCRHVEEAKEAWFRYKELGHEEAYNEFRIALRGTGFNSIAGLHTIVLKEKNLYKEEFEKTELVEVGGKKVIKMAKVINASSNDWYHNFIGRKFQIRGEFNNTYLVAVNNEEGGEKHEYIMKWDAEVIEIEVNA